MPYQVSPCLSQFTCILESVGKKTVVYGLSYALYCMAVVDKDLWSCCGMTFLKSFQECTLVLDLERKCAGGRPLGL